MTEKKNTGEVRKFLGNLGIISIIISVIGLLYILSLFLISLNNSTTMDIWNDPTILYAIPFAIARIIFGLVGVLCDPNPKISKYGLELSLLLLALSILK